MGSFWGHVDEGIFFTLMAMWWMFNAYKDYILGQSLGQEVKPKMSYPVLIGKKSYPVEIIVIKILFPVGAFIAEMCDGGSQFIGPHGEFHKLVNQQHMAMYGNFLIHGVTDLMHHFGKPIYPGMHYITVVVTFCWFGVGMYTHASMHGREPVDQVMHVLIIYCTVILFFATVLEIYWRSGVWTIVVRSYAVLTMGTWFFHMGFMLFVHDKFPGGEKSDLDLMAPRNATFVKAMFGLHILFNAIILMVVYVITYWALRLTYGIRLETTPLRDECHSPQISYRPLASVGEEHCYVNSCKKRQTVADAFIDDGSGNHVNSPLHDI